MAYDPCINEDRFHQATVYKDDLCRYCWEKRKRQQRAAKLKEEKIQMNWTLKLEEIDLMRRHVLDKKPTENWTNFHWFEWGQMDLLRRWLKDVHAELKVAQLCLTMGDNSKQTERKLEKDIERYTILREALYERVKDILDHIYSVWGIKGDEEVPV